jgi:hypothetical protein
MKKVLSISLCLILLLTLLPVVALAGDIFQVTVDVGPNGTIFFGDPPPEGEEDARDVFTSETDPATIEIEANEEGADTTNVFIEVLPDEGYEIESVTLGDTLYEVGQSTETDPPHEVRPNGFGGNLPCGLLKTEADTYYIAATFIAEEEPGGEGPGGGEPGGGEPGGGSYTLTLTVGENGSVTSVTRRVDDADVPVLPDEENGNTYTVPAGSDVTFTFEPDEGYIIDELWVDGMMEWLNPDNTYTLYGVNRSQPVEVTFMQAVEYTVTVPEIDHVTIEIFKNGEPVVLENNQFTSMTRDMVTYILTIDEGYRLSEFNTRRSDGLREGIFVNYDPDGGFLYSDVETNFSYTVEIETEELTDLPALYYAIVDSESGEADIKAAIRRELGLQSVVVSDEDITVEDDDAPAIAGGVDYKKVTVGELGVAHFYIVDNAKTLLILTEPVGGNAELTVYDGSGLADFEPANITIPPISSGKMYAFGPYGAFAMDMSHALGLDLRVSAGAYGSYEVTGEFFNMQWHVVNFGTPPDTAVNWYPTNVITADAIYIEAEAAKNGTSQEASRWAIDTSPRINRMDEDGRLHYRLEVFFGNDTVTISPPASGNVTAVSVAEPSDSPGYTFADDGDRVVVTFLSDFYDLVTVPVTLTIGGSETRQANVTIRRVGVEVQEHNIEDYSGEDVSTVVVAHGTQHGSVLDLSEYGFRLTASYYIPDGGSTEPYGLFVTRTYANGRVETQTILASMEGVIDHGSAANAVDYIIYSGTSRASAPASVSVLVLKEEPDENAFGGVSFGSGAGVTWTK